MRVAIVGIGGLGAYFGVVLARAGHDVSLVARGAHLEALRARGLTLRSPTLGEVRLAVSATDRPEVVGPVDLVLLCTKTYDLDAAVDQSRPLIGPATVALPVQNGVDAGERVGRVVGAERVLRGIAYFGGFIAAPGVVAHTGGSRLLIGEPGGGSSARAERLLALLTAAGVAAEISPDTRLAEWEKFVAVCGSFGVLALARLPFGPVLACPETRSLLRGVVEEAVWVARASGVGLAEDHAERVMALYASYAPWVRSSMLTDLLAGKRLELESVSGELVRLGARLGVPTPLNYAAYAALRPYVGGAPVVPAPP